MKILVTDGIAAEGRALLESAARIEPDIRSGLEPGELKRIIKNYQGVIVRSATKVTAEVIEAADGNLKVIGRAGIGVDNVDVAAATRNGIVVMNTPEANAVTTAEHAIALMFSLARQIPQAHISTASGKWERGKFKGIELFGKTLGLIGLGTIGKLVAERAIGVKMSAVAYDPFLAPEAAERIGVKPVLLDDALRSDVVTIHAPLTPETKNLIDARAMGKMKPGAILINCARGGIVDETALCEAVESGKIAGAALDVFSCEPPGEGSPALRNPDKTVLTPHLGASTREAQEKVGAAIARQIIDFSEGVVKNAVNMPSLDAGSAERMAPYIALAEKLGSFLGQTCRGAGRMELEFGGDLADFDTRVLVLSALKGFLSPVMDTVVTNVNAPVIAQDRGIEVVESKTSASGDYTNIITASVSTPEGGRSVSGVIFGKKEPRFVMVDGVALDVVPEGVLLISENYDRPGLIAGMCAIISKAGVNIARMHLGREEVGGRAIVFTSVDSPVAERHMAEIAALKDIISITQVEL